MRGLGVMGIWLLALLLAGAIASDVALAKTRKHSGPSSCSLGLSSPSSRPTAETMPLDPAITSMFAVLRRPAGPEDQLPLFNPLNEDLGYQLRSYLPGYIRQLASDPDGERYFLIVGFERGFALPPAHCLPKVLRRHLTQLIAEQRERERQPVYCIEDVGPRRSQYGAPCQPFATIQTEGSLIASAQSTSEVIDLVPDGVVSVRLHYRNGTTITAPVANNEFGFTPPQGPIKKARARVRRLNRELINDHRRRSRKLRSLLKRLMNIYRRLPPKTVQWLGVNGQIIRTLQPRPGGGSSDIGAIFIGPA